MVTNYGKEPLKIIQTWSKHHKELSYPYKKYLNKYTQKTELQINSILTDPL